MAPGIMKYPIEIIVIFYIDSQALSIYGVLDHEVSNRKHCYILYRFVGFQCLCTTWVIIKILLTQKSSNALTLDKLSCSIVFQCLFDTMYYTKMAFDSKATLIRLTMTFIIVLLFKTNRKNQQKEKSCPKNKKNIVLLSQANTYKLEKEKDWPTNDQTFHFVIPNKQTYARERTILSEKYIN